MNKSVKICHAYYTVIISQPVRQRNHSKNLMPSATTFKKAWKGRYRLKCGPHLQEQNKKLCFPVALTGIILRLLEKTKKSHYASEYSFMACRKNMRIPFPLHSCPPL